MPGPRSLRREVLTGDHVITREARAREQEPADDQVRAPAGLWRSRDQLDEHVLLAALCRDRRGRHAAAIRHNGAAARHDRADEGGQRGGNPSHPALTSGRATAGGTSGSGDPCRPWPAPRGRVRRNTDPFPGPPHACSQPPCKRASSSAIASPSPVPPLVRARAGSARQKRSKTIVSSPGRNPTPKSRTAMATAYRSPAARTWTALPSPCSTAFTIR